MLAGVCFFSVMALVVSNIILRNVFKLPILGTVEIVGLLTVTGLGLALSNCEMQDFNTAMDVFTEKLPKKAQKIIDMFVYAISLVFFAIVVWRMFIFAGTSFANGRVTPTTSIPIFPFIFILGVNVFFLCVVLMYKLACTIKEVSEFKKSADEREGEST
jgi:TRAP-type C4-dicarboxylate transport system permease small subunit